MFKKILIANRGEIACRIVRTARRLGCRTVAVYSQADADALHVQMADEAVCIGAAPASESYLNIDALLAAARHTVCDAVHPGYGFLSERAEFARACQNAGLVFIGPSPEAIEAMGDKAEAKRRMQAAGVPCVPGYLGESQDVAVLQREAERLGLPLLVKAAAGGGGRGMRLVHEMAQLPDALASAAREAQSSFGDGQLMLERLIERGKHIEIQIFADAHGNAVHLGERDCSAQRRRQKVIEEAPSPVVSEVLRQAMGRDAVAAALAVGYVGAGTVEFIVDEAMQHYFLEMNTRLQVEHPVTECITGLDLVEWQLRVAAGEPLPLAQEDIRHEGHAIEVRLYAEDPYANYQPQTGRVSHWQPERHLQAGVRIDHGLQPGQTISPFYDPMLAKFIAHGRDRREAAMRLIAALDATPLLGVTHNARFLRDLLAHPAFAEASLHTTGLDALQAQGDALFMRPEPEAQDWLLAAACLALGLPNTAHSLGLRSAAVASLDLAVQWVNGACAPSATVPARRFRATFDLRTKTRVTISPLTDDSEAAPTSFECLSLRDGMLHYRLNDLSEHRVRIHAQGGSEVPVGQAVQGAQGAQGGPLTLVREAYPFCFAEPSPWPDTHARTDPNCVRAPVAGVLSTLRVAVGDAVQAGQTLATLEAMKMEMNLSAPGAAHVRAIAAHAGQSVNAGDLIIELEPEAAPP